jgi:hypothetical protein
MTHSAHRPPALPAYPLQRQKISLLQILQKQSNLTDHSDFAMKVVKLGWTPKIKEKELFEMKHSKM